MAFVTIDPANLAVGKSLKKNLFDKIKSNSDDHETRINNLEAGAAKVDVANFEIGGYIDHYSVGELSAVATHNSTVDFNLLELEIIIIDSPNAFDADDNPITTSTSGVLEVDLLKSTDNGANFQTILTTRPAIVAGENGASSSSNDVANTTTVFASTSIDQGDILKIKVTSKKDVQGSFMLVCYGSID